MRLRLVLRSLGRNFNLVSYGIWEDMVKSYPLESSLTGKTVVDVGCDYGNSPLYWRARGAAKIIGYEKNPSFQRRLRYSLMKYPWFEFRGVWNGEMPEGDVFKMDCEGCESNLKLEELSRYGTWFVAIHDLPKLDVDTIWLGPRLEALGGKIVNAHPLNREVSYKGGRVP